MIQVFGRHIPRSFLLLLFVEYLIIVFSVYAGTELRFMDADGIPPHDILPKALIFAAIISLSMISMGLYHRGNRDTADMVVLRIAVSYILGVVALSLVFYIFPDIFLGRGIVFIATVFALLGIIATRYLFFRFVDHRILKARALVLGAGDKAKLITHLRRKTDKRDIKILGFIPLPGQNDQIDASHLVHLDRPLSQYVVDYDIDDIIVAPDDMRDSLPIDELLDCKLKGINVYDLLSFFEKQTGKVRNDILQPGWVIFSDGFSGGELRVYVKRLMDITLGFVSLILSLPLMFITALAIWAESGFSGPVFYKQKRVGQAGKEFDLVKFRSMRTDAENDGIARWAVKNDSRISKVGRVIRKTRIDELPQLINVLRGEMSFVGPRPERPVFVSELSRKIPYYKERCRVKPGITGWAQIRFPYGASEEEAIEKLQYDLYYVKNYNILFDLTIMLQTVEVVLFGKGAR